MTLQNAEIFTVFFRADFLAKIKTALPFARPFKMKGLCAANRRFL